MSKRRARGKRSKPSHYDDEPIYRNPTGWRRMKEIAGEGSILYEALVRLEGATDGLRCVGMNSPRDVLLAALHAFLAMPNYLRAEVVSQHAQYRPPQLPQVVERVELYGRAYDVVVVAGYPKDVHGRECCCFVDHGRRRIEVGEHESRSQARWLISEAAKDMPPPDGRR